MDSETIAAFQRHGFDREASGRVDAAVMGRCAADPTKTYAQHYQEMCAEADRLSRECERDPGADGSGEQLSKLSGAFAEVERSLYEIEARISPRLGLCPYRRRVGTYSRQVATKKDCGYCTSGQAHPSPLFEKRRGL